MLSKELGRWLKRIRGGNKPVGWQERTQLFPADLIREFRFFQFNLGNVTYFVRHNSGMDVRMVDTPHFAFAKASRDPDSGAMRAAKSSYLEYLKASWPASGLDTGLEHRESKCQFFLDHITAIETAQQVGNPVLLTRIPGKPGLYVLDGNHRCAIAAALGLSVPAKVLDFTTAFDHFLRVDEFYGTGSKEMPYQSAYLNRQIVRQGRRDDIYERLDALPAGFLQGKTVVDVGCNIGMNAIGARKCGATKVLGLEVSKRMANYATRFAVFDGCYPSVSFLPFVANVDQLPAGERYDVAFMLSIHNHLEHPGNLAEIVRRNVVEAVVFEGHPKTRLGDYQGFLDAVQFSRIEKITDMATSVFDRTPSRPVWILYK